MNRGSSAHKEHELNTPVMRWALKIAGRDTAASIVVLALDIAVGAGTAFQAVLFRNVIDSAVARNLGSVVSSSLALAALLLAIMLAGALNGYLKALISTRLENSFKEHLFKQILQGDYAGVNALHSGDWMTRLGSDSSVVANSVSSLIPSLGGIIARLVSAAAVLISFDPVLGFFVLVAGALAIFPSAAMRKRFKELHKRVQEKGSEIRIHMQESLASLLVIHSFAQEQSMLNTAHELMGEQRSRTLKRARANNVFGLIRSILSHGIYGLAALWCVRGIYLGTMSYGTLAAILQLVSQVQAPLSNIAGYAPGIYAALASAERLYEVESLAQTYSAFTQDEPANIADFISFGLEDVDFSYKKVEDDARKRLSDTVSESDAVSEENIEEQEATIRNISLSVRRGSHVAFSGPSGCGKSTALKLFMCLYPIQKGSRSYVDSEGTHELANYARWLFAYVPQGNMLMSGTIREIVSFGDTGPSADNERIWEALRISCADEFVRELDSGLDTKLGEGGLGLSEGQMQRIAIARAIYSGRPVLLLDESTSALDEYTEAQLLRRLRELEDKTVLIVTHRKAALGIVDTIAHFDEGNFWIEQTGSTQTQS